MSMTNCVNCGSAKDAHATVCPFCGTSYFDLTDIDLGERQSPCIVRFKYHDNVFQMKAFIGLAEFTLRPVTMEITNLNDSYRRYIDCRQDVRANIEFICAE